MCIVHAGLLQGRHDTIELGDARHGPYAHAIHLTAGEDILTNEDRAIAAATQLRCQVFGSANAPACTNKGVAACVAGAASTGMAALRGGVPATGIGALGSMVRTSTMAVPFLSMSSLAAALYDKSMMRLPTNGPRSFTRTTTLRPFCKLVTRT
jgi:hypothetical protein